MKQAIKKSIKEAYNIDDKKTIMTLVIDGNSVMKRAMVNTSIDTKGKECGMVLQSLITIREVIGIRDFDHCYFMMDGDGSGQLRAYLYEDYKANRDKHYFTMPATEYDRKLDEYMRRCIAYHNRVNAKKEKVRSETEDESFLRQRDILAEILETLSIRTFMYQDVEGDDLIAYYVKNKEPNEKIIIVSGDRDLTQLISDDVMVYILDKKTYVHKNNEIKELGMPSENIVLKKMICGDSSDNIKGIKGVGETTLQKLFPDILTRPMTLDEIISQANQINEQRAKEKKKPLLACTNIVERNTDGIQGKDIYEINNRLIDLSDPLLTDEAKNDLDEKLGAPLDTDGRDFRTLYQIIRSNNLYTLYKDDNFSKFFAPFSRLMDNEKKFFEESE